MPTLPLGVPNLLDQAAAIFLVPAGDYDHVDTVPHGGIRSRDGYDIPGGLWVYRRT